MMEFRRTNTALMFSYHPSSCISCANSGKCEARSVCAGLDLTDSAMSSVISKYDSKPEVTNVGKSATMGDDFSSHIVKIKDLCINCDRCISMINWVDTQSELLGLPPKTNASSAANALIDVQLEPLSKNQKLNK